MSVVAAGSLADWLRAQPDERLAALLAARPDLLHPVPSDVTTLARRANSRASVEVALDRLDLGAVQALEALALLCSTGSPPPSLPALAELLDVEPATLTRPIDALRDAGLVFGPDDDLAVLPVIEDLLPFPAALGPPARLALTELPASRLPGVLSDLASLLGEPPPVTDGLRASELLEMVAHHFEDDVALDRLLAAIPPTPREVVDLLAAGPPVGRTAGARRPVDAATAQSPLAWLLAHAILTPLDDYTVVLPREIGLRLRAGQPMGELALEPPALVGPTHPTKTVDATAAGQAFTAVRLVESLLERWSVEPPGVLKAGGLGVRELRRAARELEVDERTAALVVEVAHVAGLLAPDTEGAETWLPTTAYDGWLARPIAARWATLATAWLTTTRVPALIGRREPEHLAGPGGPVGARSSSAPNALGPEVDRALAPIVRRAVLAVLAAAQPGHAPEPAALVDAVGWRMPRRGGRLRDDLVRWTGEEAELLGVTGRAALSSFGRALVAAMADDASDGGPADPTAAAVALLEPQLPQPLDHVLLQADLTAVAPGPLDSEFGRELALLADVESTGGATVYRFSASSIRRALDAGYAAADIQALLAQRSRTPVPQPLQYLVDDVARRHGRLRVGAAGAYLRCDDDALLGEVIADRRAENLRLHRIAPTVAISPLAPERVAQRLRELGYAPGAESPDGGLLLRRPDARRTNARPRLARPRAEFAPPSEAMLTMAVRAIRGGDKAAAVAKRRVTAGQPSSDVLPHSVASDTLATLHEAVETNRAVWIGYLNAQGQASSRIVEPLRLAGGYLTAFDHRHDEVRTFAVHRITGVAAVDDTDSVPTDTTGEAI
jgi:DNA-binding IscR family transcriptional regulator